MGSLKDLIDAVGTAATNGVLRERLALFIDEAQRMEKEKGRLEARVSELEEQLKSALHKLASSRDDAEFVEHRGALFKRSGGSYVKAVYCPVCRSSVGSIDGEVPYFCHRCKWMADFTGNQLESVMAGLP